MPDDFYCPIGIAVILTTIALAILLIRSVPRAQMFKDWREVFEAWRQTRGFWEGCIFFGLFARHISRGSAIAILLGMLTLAGTIWSGLCGLSPDTLRVIREILSDALKTIGPSRTDGLRSPSEMNCLLG